MPSDKNRKSKAVRFNDVTIYHFQRTQGFVCVPADSGATLGMKFCHDYCESFSLSKYQSVKEWEAECEENESYNQLLMARVCGQTGPEYQWTLSMIKSNKNAKQSRPIYPLSYRQRVNKLKSAGVELIDPSERDDCNMIRQSRIYCGCTCQDGCKASCPCSEAGVPCQVEKVNAGSSYPCPCGEKGCSNISGRTEYELASIKEAVMKSIERSSKEFEVPSQNGDSPHEDAPVINETVSLSDLLISIDDGNWTPPEFDRDNECVPNPEVFCNKFILQKATHSNFIPGYPLFDCGCCKFDPSIETCPNCTSQPMDVGENVEAENESCPECGQTPCIAIDMMTRELKQLVLYSDTHDQSTMTNVCSNYVDLEEEITGVKQPLPTSDEALNGKSDSKKRSYSYTDELDRQESSLFKSQFQKSFLSFLVGSRKMISASKTKSNLKATTGKSLNGITIVSDDYDNMPELVSDFPGVVVNGVINFSNGEGGNNRESDKVQALDDPRIESNLDTLSQFTQIKSKSCHSLTSFTPRHGNVPVGIAVPIPSGGDSGRGDAPSELNSDTSFIVNSYANYSSSLPVDACIVPLPEVLSENHNQLSSLNDSLGGEDTLGSLRSAPSLLTGECVSGGIDSPASQLIPISERNQHMTMRSTGKKRNKLSDSESSPPKETSLKRVCCPSLSVEHTCHPGSLSDLALIANSASPEYFTKSESLHVITSSNDSSSNHNITSSNINTAESHSHNTAAYGSSSQKCLITNSPYNHSSTEKISEPMIPLDPPVTSSNDPMPHGYTSLFYQSLFSSAQSYIFNPLSGIWNFSTGDSKLSCDSDLVNHFIQDIKSRIAGPKISSVKISTSDQELPSF